MSPRIALIDYGSGNLRSVAKALEAVGATVRRISAGPIPTDIQAVVLPGQGSFGDSVRELQGRALFKETRDWISQGRKFLGICLGYQLLFSQSEESPDARGFEIFTGSVRRFRAKGIKIPHIGWNQLQWCKKKAELPPQPYVYFDHAYYPAPEDRSIVLAMADHGEVFAAALESGNTLAVQFHPEKSQENGLAILRYFVNSIP